MFRLRHEEEGASMVFVAVILVALFGMVAFAVDTAAIYQERRELQNGADAAVLAIAEDCGRNTKACDTPTATSTADDYADFNAADDRARIFDLSLDTAAQTVEVTAATEEADGGTIFRPFFAQVIGFTGLEVGARASAAWGAPAGLPTLPMIFSDCEWEKFKGQISPAPWWGDDVDDTGVREVARVFVHGQESLDCHHSPSGQDLPGGFGWLEENDPDTLCSTLTQVGTYADAKPGAPPPSGCDAKDLADNLLGKPVAIPFFGAVTVDGVEATDGATVLQGANAQYFVTGYSYMLVTGYNFGGQFKAKSIDPLSPFFGGNPCENPDTPGADAENRCIEGHFFEGTSYSGQIGDGDYRGVLIVKLTG